MRTMIICTMTICTMTICTMTICTMTIRAMIIRPVAVGPAVGAHSSPPRGSTGPYTARPSSWSLSIRRVRCSPSSTNSTAAAA